MNPLTQLLVSIGFVAAGYAGGADARADASPPPSKFLSQVDIDSACSDAHRVVISQSRSMSGTLSIPVGCTLFFSPRGRIDLTEKSSLQLHGNVAADADQQVFASAASASPGFVQGYGVQRVSVKWFGARGDGSGNDNDAFEAASRFAATTQSIDIHIPRGTYIVGKEDAIKPVYDKITALFSQSQVAVLQATMDALIARGILFSNQNSDQLKAQWQTSDRALPYLSSIGVHLLYTSRTDGLDADSLASVLEFRARLKNNLSADEIAEVAALKRAFAPRDTLAFVKVPEVRISGDQDAAGHLLSKLALEPGLRFGAFDPNTGEPHRSYNAQGRETATLIPFYFAFSGPMISVTGADSVEITALELDGNSDRLALGGFVGDTGYQLQNDGIYLQQNKRASIRHLFTHHHGTDGIGVRWSGLTETAPDYPHVLDHVRADYNGRNGITISDANDLVVTNSDVDFTATGKVSSLPRAGIDIESEDVIRNARFENDNFIGNRGSQISATWNVSYLSFDRVHAKGQQALWMRAPGITFRHSLIEGLVTGLPYGDGQVVNHHAWQGQQVVCPSIALVDGQRIVLDTATATQEGGDPSKPESYCPGYKTAGVSLATRITDTQFVADSDITTGAWNGGMSAGENVFFANDLFKVIVRDGSGMRLPDFAVRSGIIRDSIFEIQKDAMTGPNLIGTLGGFRLEGFSIRRVFGPGVKPIDNAFIRCLKNAPNEIVQVMMVHLRWCSPDSLTQPSGQQK